MAHVFFTIVGFFGGIILMSFFVYRNERKRVLVKLDNCSMNLRRINQVLSFNPDVWPKAHFDHELGQYFENNKTNRKRLSSFTDVDAFETNHNKEILVVWFSDNIIEFVQFKGIIYVNPFKND